MCILLRSLVHHVHVSSLKRLCSWIPWYSPLPYNRLSSSSFREIAKKTRALDSFQAICFQAKKKKKEKERKSFIIQALFSLTYFTLQVFRVCLQSRTKVSRGTFPRGKMCFFEITAKSKTSKDEGEKLSYSERWPAKYYVNILLQERVVSP